MNDCCVQGPALDAGIQNRKILPLIPTPNHPSSVPPPSGGKDNPPGLFHALHVANVMKA